MMPGDVGIHLLQTHQLNCIFQRGGGGYQILSDCIFGFFPAILINTLCWKIPRSCPMHWFINHIYAPNNRTAWTMYRKKWTNVLGLDPSLPKIWYRQAQLFRAF